MLVFMCKVVVQVGCWGFMCGFVVCMRFVVCLGVLWCLVNACTQSMGPTHTLGMGERGMHGGDRSYLPVEWVVVVVAATGLTCLWCCVCGSVLVCWFAWLGFSGCGWRGLLG